MSGVLILSWRREVPRTLPSGTVWVDPIWEALTPMRAGKGRKWTLGYATVLPELRLHELVLEDRNAYSGLKPRLSGYGGEIFDGALGGKIFRSEMRLLTDGPTVPALRVLTPLLAELKPGLVVSVGLGGGVRSTDQVGDVVVATHAQFSLSGRDLAAVEFDDQTFGGEVAVDEAWFDGLEFPELREPPLLPSSPSFDQPPNGWPQPPSHRPVVRVEHVRPLLTRPASDADTIVPAEVGHPLGDSAAAVDMDAAVAAKICQDEQTPFLAVVGISVPALVRPPVDWQGTLMDAWTETLDREFAASAAINVVAVTRRLVEHAVVSTS